MNDLNIISDVIIPIVASFIGGILTLGGVIITINSQKKKDIEDKKLRIKPYFYANNSYQIINGLDKADDFVMVNESKIKGDYEIEGIIVIDGKYYFPEHGNIIDKDTIFYLYIFPDEIKNANEIYLTVTDVMNNEYYYKLECCFDGKKYYEIQGFEELEK